MKIQLVNAPLTPEFRLSIRAGAFPPLHLAALAAFLRLHSPQTEIGILDGELLSSEGIIGRLDADVVGISCNSLTYESALRIATAAKAKGARVVLGGAHPTFLGQEILKNRSFIDAAVFGDGEEALLAIVNGKAMVEIPNLIFRDRGHIRVNSADSPGLDTLPDPDYRDMELSEYHRNYTRLYPDKPFSHPFAGYSAKGCQWRDRTGGGCTFCAIQHSGFRMKGAEGFWAELVRTSEEWAADFFWDVSDTFTMQREWLEQFAASKPAAADFSFQVYGRSSDIDQAVADLLARIGVYEVFLGVESGSNQTLRASGKGISVEDNLNAVKSLNRAGIRAVISVVMGLPGETEQTLSATIGMVEELLAWGNLSEINGSILLPLPGSRAMAELRREVPAQDGQEDLFDPENLRSEWVERFCQVSYDRLIEVQGQIMALHPRVGAFGRTIREAEEQEWVQDGRKISGF